MAEKVEIVVELKDQAARQGVQQWLNWINQLNKGATVNITANTTGIDRAIQRTTTLSSALNNIGGVFSTIGNAFTGIGNLFNLDLLGTVERTLTAYGTILATQGIKSAITRYDIMTTYADYMEIMGVSAEKADESLEKVNQAIQGIPVGLDTAAQEIRLFTMYLQGSADSMDEVADKATNLTIGLERALVAGGASEAMKTTAKYEVQRLLATGSLNTKRQWQALLNGLGVSGQYLKDVMGYGDLSTQDFIGQLTGGDISTDSFLEGLAALADYEGLNKAIDIYKTTIEAGMYDIRFAVTRGFANTFMAINETLEKETGKGIRDYMQDIRQGVNDVFADVQGWVRDHPEVLTMILEKFNEVMQRAKELNIGETMERIATEGGKMVDFLIRLYDALPEGFMQDLIVFSMTWAGPLGRLFTGIGTIFNTLGRFTGFLGRLPLIGRLFSGLFNFGGAAGTVITGSSIRNTFAGLGAIAGMGAIVAEVGGILYEFALVAEKLASVNLDGYEDNLLKIKPLIVDVMMAVGTLVGAFGVGSMMFGSGVAMFALLGEAVAGGLLLEIGYSAQIIESFADVAQKIANLELGGDFEGKVNDLAKGIKSVYESLPTLTDEDVTSSGLYNAFFTNMAGAITGMATAVTALTENQESFNALSNTEEVANKVSEIAAGLGAIYDALNAEFGLGFLDKWGSANYPEIITNMGTAIEDISEVAVKLKEIQTEIANLGLGLTGELVEKQIDVGGGYVRTETDYAEDGYQILVRKIEEMMGGVKKVMDLFGKGWINTMFENWKSTTQSKTIDNIKQAMTDIGDIAVAVSDAATNIARVNTASAHTGTSVVDYFKNNFAPFIEGVRDALGAAGMSTFKSKIHELQIIVNSVKDLVETLAGTDFSDLDTSLADVAKTLNDDINPAMGTFRDTTNDARQNTGNLVRYIGSLGSMASLKMPDISALTGVITNLATQMSIAAGSANALTSSLNAIPRNINIGINKTISATPLQSMWGIGYATGGPVGTDTIPAWLSPGEFVMRSKAVQTFGQQFMAQINALNIPGALNTLVRHYTVPQTAHVNNISNRDNHATLNQTIYTNSPDYSYRRASRYVRAL